MTDSNVPTEDDSIIKEPLIENTMDNIVTLNLLTWSLFLYDSDDCLICQPQANYQPLHINDLTKKACKDALPSTNTNINEEMYITV
jgi:hypothetical protein